MFGAGPLILLCLAGNAPAVPLPPIAVSLTGTGNDAPEWRSAPLPLKAGWVYRLRFKVRTRGGGGGTVTSGAVFCNRDLGVPGAAWREITSVFVAPADLKPDDARLKFGEWMRPGAVEVGEVALDPCDAVYLHAGPFELGD